MTFEIGGSRLSAEIHFSVVSKIFMIVSASQQLGEEWIVKTRQGNTSTLNRTWPALVAKLQSCMLRLDQTPHGIFFSKIAHESQFSRHAANNREMFGQPAKCIHVWENNNRATFHISAPCSTREGHKQEEHGHRNIGTFDLSPEIPVGFKNCLSLKVTDRTHVRQECFQSLSAFLLPNAELLL